MGKFNIRMLLMIVIGLLFLILVACGGGTESMDNNTETNAADQESKVDSFKFRIAHNMPVEHHTAQGIELFKDLIEEKSDGNIEVSIFPSGQLYDDTSIAEAIISGQVEVGMTTMQMWTGHIPSVSFFSTQMLLNYEDLHKVLDGGVSDILAEEFEKHNSYPLIWGDYGFGYIASIKKPLETPEDYKGMRIRVLSPLDAYFVEQAGGSPISMGGGEVDQALERGTIDAAMSGTTSFNARQYDRYTKYFSGPVNAGIFPVVANLDWWNGLSGEAQTIIHEASVEATEWITQASKDGEEAAAEALAEKGMEYVEMDEDAFADVYEAVIQEYIEENGEVAERIVETTREALSQ